MATRTSTIAYIDTVHYQDGTLVITLKDRTIITTTAETTISGTLTTLISEGRRQPLLGMFDPDIVVGYDFDIHVSVEGEPDATMFTVDRTERKS